MDRRRTRLHLLNRSVARLKSNVPGQDLGILRGAETISSRNGQYGDVKGGVDSTRCSVPESSRGLGGGSCHDALSRTGFFGIRCRAPELRAEPSDALDHL